MPDDQTPLANIELNPFVPDWAGLETEVGEINGTLGLSTDEEALFFIQVFNAHNIFPDWIALNNGTTHGIEQSGTGIDVQLTAQIHEALSPYRISGGQHGTSGNNSDKLQTIASNTSTTKANVAKALQMVSWDIKVNDYGNALLDDNGNFIKKKEDGVTEEIWSKMVAYATANGLKGWGVKKLNLPFENYLIALPGERRQKMKKTVEEFSHE